MNNSIPYRFTFNVVRKTIYSFIDKMSHNKNSLVQLTKDLEEFPYYERLYVVYDERKAIFVTYLFEDAVKVFKNCMSQYFDFTIKVLEFDPPSDPLT